jgi:hypothetical protein
MGEEGNGYEEMDREVIDWKGGMMLDIKPPCDISIENAHYRGHFLKPYIDDIMHRKHITKDRFQIF